MTALLDLYSDPFASLLGSGRGRPEADTLGARRPSADMRRRARALMSAEDVSGAVEELRAHRNDLDAPLMRDLSAHVANRVTKFVAADLADGAARAMRRIGAVPFRAPNEVARQRGRVHLWPDGHKFASLLELHHHAARKVDFGKTLCGQQVTDAHFSRPQTGTWLSDPELRCSRCNAHSDRPGLPSHDWPGNVLSPEADAAVLAAGQARANETLRSNLLQGHAAAPEELRVWCEASWTHALLTAAAGRLAARDVPGLYDCLNQAFPVEVVRAERDAGVEPHSVALEGLLDAQAWRAALAGMEGHDRRGRVMLGQMLDERRYVITRHVRAALDARIAASRA